MESAPTCQEVGDWNRQELFAEGDALGSVTSRFHVDDPGGRNRSRDPGIEVVGLHARPWSMWRSSLVGGDLHEEGAFTVAEGGVIL
jgi:hypothetical protein